MDEYIYIILAAVYIIYSIIKAAGKVSKNKPRTSKPQTASRPVQQTQQQPKPKPGDVFKKILDEMLGEIPQVTVPEKQKPKTKAPPQQYIRKERAKIISSQQETFQELQTKQKAHKISTPVAKQRHHIEISEPIAVPEEEPSVEFSVRDAVVYSEILKRPNW